MDLLRALVDVDSGPGDVAGIDTVYDTLVDRLVPLGFQFDRHETAGLDVLRGRRIGTGSARMRLVLVGHADTVFPSGTVADRPMEIHGDRVTGPGVARPRNLRARFGTPLENLVEQAGGYRPDAARLIVGGPLMGYAVPSDDLPLVKACNCLLVLTEALYRGWPVEGAVRELGW